PRQSRRHLRGQINRLEYAVTLKVSLHRSLFLLSKSRSLGQHDHWNSIFVERPFGSHNKVAGRIDDAKTVQGVHRHRDNTQCLPRLTKLPASDGDHALRFEMLEIFPERFHGVEIVFAQCESSGSGRGPGIHQRHLYDVEVLGRGAQIRTAISNVNVNFRTFVEMLGVSSISSAHDGIGNDGIDFDAGYAGTAIRYRAQHIHTPPRPDNGVVAARPKYVGQRWRGRHKITFPFGVALVCQVTVQDEGGCVSVYHDSLGLTLAVNFPARQSIPAG